MAEKHKKAEKAEEQVIGWENPEGDAVEFYTDHKGEWRWRVQSRNGDILAVSSEGYANELDARRGLRAADVIVRIWRMEVIGG